MNIVLIGMPGCGKTFIGRMIAENTGMRFLDMDAEIEKRENRTISEIFASDGEVYFRVEETKLISELSEEDNIIISTGGGIVKNKLNMDIAKKNGVVIFINRSVDDIASDVKIAHRPLLANGAEALYKLYEERISLYKAYADAEVKNDTDAAEVSKRVIEVFERKKNVI